MAARMAQMVVRIQHKLMAQRLTHPHRGHDRVIFRMLPRRGILRHRPTAGPLHAPQQPQQVATGNIAPLPVAEVLINRHHPRRPGRAVGQVGAEQQPFAA